MGSDKRKDGESGRGHGFNPRSRMGSDSVRLVQLRWAFVFQSTLPHGERRLKHIGILGNNRVSIHAPAWGATASWGETGCLGDVSIHAPAWGATGKGVVL